MLTRVFAIAALLLGGATAYGGLTQRSSLHLRQEQQPLYWPRYGTHLSGRYHNQVWLANPDRAAYGQFRGGGPGTGK
ncbi:MAG TPA: hypothetical protein V6D07_09925 [Trichocoleus sp.]